MPDSTTPRQDQGLFSNSTSHMRAVEAASVLERAQELIHGDREADYGDPKENMQCVADMWDAYLRGGIDNDNADRIPVTAHDVCAMLIMLKLARMQEKGYHDDGVVDVCGYGGLMERVK